MVKDKPNSHSYQIKIFSLLHKKANIYNNNNNSNKKAQGLINACFSYNLFCMSLWRALQRNYSLEVGLPLIEMFGIK